MRRLRRSTKQYVVIVLLSLLVVGTSFVIAYLCILRNIEKNYGIQIKALSKEMEVNQRYVYEAAVDIDAGTYLSESLLTYKKVYTGQNRNTFIAKEDLGKVALISIPKGVYVQKSMVREEKLGDDLREADFTCIQLSNHVNTNDTIDIRIVYPNGENYIVLSKKAVKECSEEKVLCYLWLTEEEILRMSSAIVDAYLYEGAYLYCTKYIEPTLQEASVVTYQPSLSIQQLIQNDPNIVEVAEKILSQQLRKELENRLANSIDLEVSEIHWEVNRTTEGQVKSQAISGQQDGGNGLEQQNSGDTNHVEENTSEQVGEDFFYYSEEVKAKEKDVEYGE